MRNFYPLITLFCCFFSLAKTLTANDLYWVNGSGKWNDPNHWSTSLNGAGGAGLPTSNSTVIINNSGQTVKIIIEFDTNISIQNLIIDQPENIILKSRIGAIFMVQNSIQWGDQVYNSPSGYIFTNPNVSVPAKQKKPVNKVITSVTVDQNNVTCFGAMDGKAWVSAITGSTGPFAYQWRRFADNVIVSTTDTASSLSGGLYSLRVTDLSDNTINQQFVVIDEPQEIGTLISIIDETCINSCDGMISLAIVGGTLPYNILWSNSATTPTINGLCDGQYSVIITDANGCVRHDTAIVGEPTLIQPTVSVTDVDCFGNCNGTAVANPTGGNGTYVNYQWSTGQNGPSNILNGLCDGTYSVTVTDSDGCTNSETFTVTEPAAPLAATLSSTDALCFGSSSGTINVNPTGGTPPYTYTWSDGPITSQNRTNLSAGTYTVTVTDANGCTYVDSKTIGQPVAISIAFTGITHVDCFGNATGSATAAPSGGTPPFTSYSWSSGALTATATGLSAGWHKVSVTDDNGCMKTDSVLITEPTPLNLTIDSQQDPLCNGSSDGFINTTPSGGTAPYTFAWSDGSSTAEDRSNLAAGTYSITLTDNNGCIINQSVTLTDPPVLTVTIDSLENVKCKGNSTGYARALAAGGTAPYSYQWSNSVVGRANPNIPAGSYTVTVTDANNCTATTNVNITEPANSLAVSISKTDASCLGTNDGSATANPTGGTAPYSYNWGGGLNTKTINGLSAGSYTVTVTDNNGCTETQSVTISQPTALSININPTNLECNGDNSGEAEANVSGGTPPYSYLWSDNQNTKTAVGLAAGNYTVTVTDDNGCTGTANVTLTEPTPLVANISSSNNVSCNAGNDGSATVSASGGTSPYSYLWSDAANQTTQTATGLLAGNYTVTVTDANGCSDVANITISQPNAISFNSSISDVTCFGNADGAINLTSVAGGTPPYSFSWSNGPTTPFISNLGPGNYTLTITDNNGCTEVNTFTISSPASALSVNVSGTNNNCAQQAIGSATANVSGGTPPYSYLWSNNQTTSSINNLAAGTYNLTVTDANGCQVNGSYTVTEPTAISFSVLNITHPSCHGSADGSISVSASGGTGALSFQWNDPASQTTASATGLDAGTYQVVVTDANGCTKDTSFTLIEPNALEITFTSSNVTCGSAISDGSATANVTGGTQPYSYSWSNSVTTASINNLSAGRYIVTVTDANNCTAIDSIDIIQATSNFTYFDTIVHNRCFGDSSGVYGIVGISGGSFPYSFTWPPNVVSQVSSPFGAIATSLPAGNYSVTISDAVGCDSVVNFTINEPPQLIVNLSGTDVSCHGTADGSVSSTVSGGVPPYSYSWSNSQTTSDLNNITAGTYTVTVTDANFCQETASIIISEPNNPIVISLNNMVHPSCPHATDGSISISATGGTGALTYQWDDPGSQTTATASNLPEGTYTITVTDANGCSKDSTFQLVDPIPMDIVFSTTNVGCNTAVLGSATANVSGGTAPYSYLWSNSETTASINNLTVGQYNVTVTDANGCVAEDSVVIQQSSNFFILDTISHNQCFGDSTGVYEILNVVGGTAPYNYAWSPNVQNFSNQLAYDLPAGNYSVTISDAGGCDTTLNFTITEPPQLVLGLNGTNVNCPGDSTGSILSNVSGGNPPYSYLWSNNQTTANLNNLRAGTYTLTVTDFSGCQIADSYTVTEPSNGINITLNNLINPSCNGLTDGSISISASGGVPPFTFLWDDPNSQTTATASNLSAGIYTVTVTDANGCTADSSFSVDTSSVKIILNKTDITCNGANDGSISTNITEGTPPYTYNWTGGLNGANPSNVSAGKYFVTVTDANGCSAIDSVEILEPDSLKAAISVDRGMACGGCDKVASVFPSGGTGQINIEWLDSLKNTINQFTQTVTNLCPGVYYAALEDANGCMDTIQVLVSDSIAKFSPTITKSDASCGNLCDGSITISENCLTSKICEIKWFYDNGLYTGVDSTTITGLCPGDYYAKITRLNCVEYYPVKINRTPNNINLDIISVDAFCNGSSTGSITSTITGGSAPYTYNWTGGLSGANPTNVAAGKYYVTVTDANGCSVNDSVEVFEPAELISSLTINNSQSCGPNTCDGTIDVSTSGGTAPYTYELFDASFNMLQTTTNPNIGLLCSGDYWVVTTDANGCADTAKALMEAVNGPVTSYTTSNENCSGSCDGEITVSMPCTDCGEHVLYDINGNELQRIKNTFIFANLCSDDYIVRSIDTLSGCSSLDTLNIGFDNSLSVSLSATDVLCNGSNTGSITSTITGGTAPYTYNWTARLSGANPANVAAGNYSVSVTDVNGCSGTASITVNEPTAITATSTSTNATCDWDLIPDGTATVIATGGTGNIQINWLDKNQDPIGQTSSTAINLDAGIYFAALMDDNGCTDTIAVLVNSTDGPSATVFSNNESCANTCDGSVSVIAGCLDNGTCTLEWRNSSGTIIGTADSIPNLCAGDYFVTITDTAGCVTNLNTSISAAQSITATLGSTNASCLTNDCIGSVFVTASGGTGTLTYEWFDNNSNMIGTNDTIDPICNAGIYFVEITDQNGCMERFSVGVSSDPNPVSVSTTDETCSNTCDGTASVAINCLTCTVRWYDANTGLAIDSMKNTITGLCTGDYFVEVSGDVGCISIEKFTINGAAPIIANASITNASCAAVADGSITLNPTGGTGSYTYNWSPVPTSGQGTNTVSGLFAGFYTVTISDASGCSLVATFEVEDPEQYAVSFNSTNATCGNADGSVTATISGGTAPYDLQWFDNANVLLVGETNPTLSNVASGTYRLRVRDNNTCEQFFSTTINDVEGPEIILDSIFHAGCFGGNTGEIYISANDVNQPLTYNWLPIGTASQDVQNLAAGTYTVIVENSLGCISSESFIINEAPELLANFSKTEADCGLCNGEANITVSGGTAPYTYLWSNGASTSSISNLCAGVYSVKVMDANNCSETFNFSISNSGGITGETTSTDPTCMNSCNGSATVNPIGGTPPYTYLWMHNGSTQNTLSNMCIGTYFLQISDFNNCTRIAEVVITGPSSNLSVSESVTPSSCDGITCDGSIFLNVTGGFAPYSYSWSPGTFADTNYIENLCAGIYEVTVTDANGCSVTKNINVNSDVAIEFDPKPRATDVSCFGACDGGLFSDHLITGQYITQWLNDRGVAIGAPNTDIPTGVCAGTYILMVSRLTGDCQEYHTVVVEEPDTIIASPTITQDLTCFGNCDGEINISALGGTLAYTYSWDDANNQTSNPAVGLCAGTYNVTITDANGCTAVTSTTLNEPTEMEIIVNNFTGVDCSSDCDGTADISINGGVAPYTYSWSGGQSVEDPTDLCYGENIVSITDAKGCVVQAIVNIPAVDTVNAVANADLDICESDEVVLSGVIEGDNISNFGWYEMPSGNLFTRTLDTTFQLPEGTYQFALVANSAICNDTDLVNVTVRPSPSIDINNSPMTLYEDESKQVLLSGKDISYIYEWTPGTDLSDSTIAEPIVAARENRTYIIVVSNLEGCTDIDSLLVKYYPELVITNGFTPNGDGVNDVWNIDFVDRYPNMEVTIFNRWGQEVFHSEGYEKPWDGTFNGEDVPVGTYYYIVDLKDEKYDPITGPLTIMR